MNILDNYLYCRERIAFELYEKTKVDEKGEATYRLWRKKIEKDPHAQRFIHYF